MKKKVIISLSSIAVIIIGCIVAISVLFNPAEPSTTEQNCKIIHNIYSQEEHKSGISSLFRGKWKTYREETLMNFGLCSSRYDKSWNGVWVIDEAFIREYVNRYSPEEFLSMYELYVGKYFEEGSTSGDIDFYRGNKELPALLNNISSSTKMIFEMTDVFDVGFCSPADSNPVNETSETQTITGKFNVGSDNHIETRSTKLYIDTMEYEGFTVRHEYGQKYSQGELGWYNGVYKDVKPSFYSVDEYDLQIDGYGWLFNGEPSLECLTCRWINTKTGRFWERRIDEYMWEDSGVLPSTIILTSDTRMVGKHKALD